MYKENEIVYNVLAVLIGFVYCKVIQVCKDNNINRVKCIRKFWSTYGVCSMKSMSSCGHEYAFLRMHLKRFISNIPLPKNAAVAVCSHDFIRVFLIIIHYHFGKIFKIYQEENFAYHEYIIKVLLDTFHTKDS